MEGKERRRITRVESYSNLYLNRYHSLKPDGNSDWKRHGRQYNIRGIDSLIRGNTFDFVVDEEVTADLEQHKRLMSEKRTEYKGQQGLEAKV